jgi:hypothetical protein
MRVSIGQVMCAFIRQHRGTSPAEVEREIVRRAKACPLVEVTSVLDGQVAGASSKAVSECAPVVLRYLE